MITHRQFAMIKNRIIWLRSYRPDDFPCKAFMIWWGKRDPFEMEKQAKKLKFKQAYRLIDAAVHGKWDGMNGVIELWNLYIEA